MKITRVKGFLEPCKVRSGQATTESRSIRTIYGSSARPVSHVLHIPRSSNADKVRLRGPEWIYHEEEHREVTSLCPCADGTLVANIAGNIYTADYEIERPVHWAQSFKPGRIVTSPWVKRGGNAKQVIKKPIPCWSMLESLTKKL